MATKTYTGTLVVVDCYQCHMSFGIPRDFYNRLHELKTDGRFTCPSCECRQYFTGLSEKEKLERKLASTQEEVNRERGWRRNAEDATDTAKRQRNALKGHLGRAKKRAAAGTCPCCNRTFRALTRHMNNQHPECVEAARQ